jgi:hypothetical protein
MDVGLCRATSGLWGLRRTASSFGVFGERLEASLASEDCGGLAR